MRMFLLALPMITMSAVSFAAAEPEPVLLKKVEQPAVSKQATAKEIVKEEGKETSNTEAAAALTTPPTSTIMESPESLMMGSGSGMQCETANISVSAYQMAGSVDEARGYSEALKAKVREAIAKVKGASAKMENENISMSTQRTDSGITPSITVNLSANYSYSILPARMAQDVFRSLTDAGIQSSLSINRVFTNECAGQ